VFRLRSSVHAFLVSLFLALTLVGCRAGIGFLYNRADWFVERRANELLEFRGSRKAELHQEVQIFFKEHRRSEIPLIVYYLNATSDLIARAEPTAAKISNSLEDVQNLMRRTLALSIPGTVRLLTSLNPSEIQTFEKNIKTKNESQLQERQETDEADWRKDRRKSFVRAFKFLAGSMTETQEKIIDEWVNQSSFEKRNWWLLERREQQSKLVQLLMKKSSSKDLEDFFRDWIFKPESFRSPENSAHWQQEQRRLQKTILDLSLSLTPKQKSLFVITLKEVGNSLRDS